MSFTFTYGIQSVKISNSNESGDIMLLTQIKYFQAVVRLGSFSKAAEECHISQSAVSQQIKVLENELGVELLERNGRSFSLTEAGRHFYEKSLIISNDIQRLITETQRLDESNTAVLNVGYYRGYGIYEFQNAVSEFSQKYPKVNIIAFPGNHEELFYAVRDGKADLVFNDQRRALSDEYINFEICETETYIQVAKHNALSALESIELDDLKNTPCILVAAKEQQEIEAEYYRETLGFKGGFVFAENLQEARMAVASGKGVIPTELSQKGEYFDDSVKMIPLMRNGKRVKRKYFAFWKADNSGYYTEEFADILKAQFV